MKKTRKRGGNVVITILFGVMLSLVTALVLTTVIMYCMDILDDGRVKRIRNFSLCTDAGTLSGRSYAHLVGDGQNTQLESASMYSCPKEPREDEGRYSREEMKFLLWAVQHGASNREIAFEIGRSVASVVQKIQQIRKTQDLPDRRKINAGRRQKSPSGSRHSR